ncbi:hypothetical protein [Microbacterium bovistercoris]|nr:hypothetical protein [Microbacterium bovistercoris]
MDHDEHGGDSACWLAQVCPECGALLDDLAAPCWRCGLKPGEEPRAAT